MPREHALRSHRGSSVEGQQRASRERDPGMAEAAEQHGRPSVPVNGEYLRMENDDFTKRFSGFTTVHCFFVLGCASEF